MPRLTDEELGRVADRACQDYLERTELPSSGKAVERFEWGVWAHVARAVRLAVLRDEVLPELMSLRERAILGDPFLDGIIARWAQEVERT